MKCYSCSQSDWHSMEDISKEGELLVCKGCGAVAYKIAEDEEVKLKEYYKTHYRPAPALHNIVTTSHKLQYIRVYLKEYLEGLKDRKIFFGDIGCATGYLPAFFKSLGHKSTGSEYTTSFRRFSEKWYGIPIPEELYRKKPYDLLSLYHVLEHLPKPEEKLADYASLLLPDGHMLISTPEWLDVLQEQSGNPMRSFELLYPKPHINLFTSQSIKNIFNQAGMEIVKEDHIQYGQTYLLKKGAKKDIVRSDYKEIVEKLKTTKAAIQLFLQTKYEDAVKLYPNFPEAWIELLLNKHAKNVDKQKEIYAEADKIVGNNAAWRTACGWWHFQHKRYEESWKSHKFTMDYKPNEETAMALGACFMELGKWDEAFEIYNIAHQLNPQKWSECMMFMCKCVSMCPTWDERAKAQFGIEAMQKMPTPELDDKIMELDKPTEVSVNGSKEKETIQTC